MKNQKGITLIALVITIIVMLILVGVSVTVALNGGLFTTAKEAAEGTASKRNEELELSSGKVEINGEWYNSIDEYVNGGSTNNPTNPSEPSGEYTAYSIGQEVTVGGESFYVIEDSDETQEKVTLLAKDCIDTTTLLQSASANTVAFSSENYWSSETNLDGLNLNEYTIPEGVTSIIATAKAYGETKGGIGRLMTHEEAETLKTVNSDILFGKNGKSSSESLDWWTCTAFDSERVYSVISLVDDFGNSMYNINLGVRPVVEISKSLIS